MPTTRRRMAKPNTPTKLWSYIFGQRDIQFLNYRSARYYNTMRDKGPILKEGDTSYLLRRNIKPKRLSNKLDHSQSGPFRIRRLRGLQITNCTRPSTYEFIQCSIYPCWNLPAKTPQSKQLPQVSIQIAKRKSTKLKRYWTNDTSRVSISSPIE